MSSETFRQEMLRRDIAAQMKWARIEGHRDVARNALKMGLQIADIMKLTNLSLEMIEELRDEIANAQSEYKQ